MKPLAILLFLTLASFPSLAEEPTADPTQLPSVPATSPADAPATFELRPGFTLELAAAEPLVVDPIDIEFDEHGRLFVVEMRGYSERREEALGRIRLLVDDNDDGTFDRATIFAQDLKWPTSVCCYDGGIFLAASPDIYYLKDTDGDGIADHKETVFTGFASDATTLNMQALVNSLTWGPGNRIWGATARNGGHVRRPGQPESEALDLSAADFSFDPRSRELRAENGTAQFGLSFDSLGRRYVSSNSNHIQWVAWERQDQPANPYYRLPSPLVSIAADGAAAPVFRISPDEPWRIIRTRWRVAGLMTGPVEGGGRVSGYFTAATGITIYDGDAFGPACLDTAFIGDAGSNLVHHKIIRTEPGAIQPIATRIDGESETEFLRSTDNWFRPVNFAVGPDGCLYICDMYREVIENPKSLPEGIKKHLDLNSGNDRGRIWRIVPENFNRPAFSLKGDSGWQRRTRQRLAYETGTPLNQPPAAHPTTSLDDPWAQAFTLNALTTPAAMIEAWNQPRTPLAFRTQLAEMIGKTGDEPAIDTLIGNLATGELSPGTGKILTAFLDGLRAARLRLVDLAFHERFTPLYTAARATATNPSAPAGDRADALQLLAYDPATESTAAIHALVADETAPDTVRTAAINALQSRGGGETTLIVHWSRFSPSLKTAALAALTTRPIALLYAVQSGDIPKEDIPLNTAALLRNHRDKEIKKLASALFPEPEVIPRETIVERYAPALHLKGDPARGATVYKTGACFTCHRSPTGEGFAVGPDLASFKTAGGDVIIKNLFDPNAEVAPQYQAYTFDLHNGETLIGIIAFEDPSGITLRMAGGIERSFPRADVAGMRGLKQSLMPEGLEAALTPQDVADLLAYIATAN